MSRFTSIRIEDHRELRHLADQHGTAINRLVSAMTILWKKASTEERAEAMRSTAGDVRQQEEATRAPVSA